MRAMPVVLILALAACDSGVDGRAGATTTTTIITSSSVPQSSTTSTTAAGPRAEGDNGRGSFSFRMPSGNTACAVSEREARCDITDKSWTPPPKPADCDLDWGNAMTVSAEGARFLCAGDTVAAEQAPVLPYGGVVERGDIRCRSTEEGVTCEHLPTGSRFLLSKDRYERD